MIIRNKPVIKSIKKVHRPDVISETSYNIFGLLKKNLKRGRHQHQDDSPPILNLPAIPVLSSPSCGSLNNNIISGTFSWSSAQYALNYYLEISNDELFTSKLYTQSYVGISNLVTYPTILSYDNIYYWRASSSNNVGSSGFSSIFYFISENTPAPLTSSLLAPSCGSSDLSIISGVFSWSAFSGATNYYIAVSSQSDFSTIIFSESFTA